MVAFSKTQQQRGLRLRCDAGDAEPRQPAAITSRSGNQTVLLTGAQRGGLLQVERLDGSHLYVDRAQLAFPAPARVTARIDSKANPEIRDEYVMWSGPVRSNYPKLRASEVEAVDHPDSNCIANTLHRNTTSIWPGYRIRDFDAFYREHGFVRCDDLNLTRCPGFEKVALFGFQPTDKRYAAARSRKEGKKKKKWPLDDGPLCLHAVVQEPAGTWTSKDGKLPRIRIASPRKLEGGQYGNILRVYIRAL